MEKRKAISGVNEEIERQFNVRLKGPLRTAVGIYKERTGKTLQQITIEALTALVGHRSDRLVGISAQQEQRLFAVLTFLREVEGRGERSPTDGGMLTFLDTLVAHYGISLVEPPSEPENHQAGS